MLGYFVLFSQTLILIAFIPYQKNKEVAFLSFYFRKKNDLFGENLIGQTKRVEWGSPSRRKNSRWVKHNFQQILQLTDF